MKYKGAEFYFDDYLPAERKELEQMVKMFMDGIKPAILLEAFRVSEEVKEAIPYKILEEELILLCKDQERLNSFEVEHTALMDGVRRYDQKKMGEFLGFPPVACEDFVSDCPDKVLVNWHGISFVCGLKNVDLVLSWMGDKYLVPQENKSGIVIIP